MSKTNPKIGDLKRQIIDALSPCFKKLGLDRASDVVYWSDSQDCARIVEITFLTTRNAEVFESTTASFSVEFGGLYPPMDWCRNEKEFPSTAFCQVRGNLLRSYPQRAPGEDLPAAEHKRRDIWWVDKSGAGLGRAIEDAVRVAQEELGACLEKLAHPKEIKPLRKSHFSWLTKQPEPKATWLLIPKVINNL